MTAKDYVGKEADHPYYGRVVVTGRPKRSKAMVEIRCIQRGPGWDELEQRYKKFFVGSSLQEDGNRSLRWRITNRDQYGEKETVHIESLTLIQ